MNDRKKKELLENTDPVILMLLGFAGGLFAVGLIGYAVLWLVIPMYGVVSFEKYYLHCWVCIGISVVAVLLAQLYWKFMFTKCGPDLDLGNLRLFELNVAVLLGVLIGVLILTFNN